ncbi:MAG: PAS domain S-box protein, partial [Pseudomonadota bacterium]
MQDLTPSMLARAGGALAAAFGFLVLLGWVLELPLLTGLELRWSPMAPSSALLFMLFGATVFASARAPISHPVRRAATVIGTAATLAALLLFFLSWQGIQLDAEHFGMAIAGTVRGAPIGHMSPLTALGFVLAGLSLLASLKSSHDSPWRTAAGFFFSGLLVCTAVVLLLGYLFVGPLLYGGTFIPPALTTSLAFAALGAGLLALAPRRTGVSAGRDDAASLRASRYLMLVFAVVAAGLVGAGILYSRYHEKLQREVIGRQLSAIADLKVIQLAQWQAERLADATFLSRSTAFTELVRHAFANPQDRQARERVHGWLRDLHQSYAYDRVDLFDAQGVARLSVPAQPVPAGHARLAREALRAGQVTFMDFHQHEPGEKIHLAILVHISGEKNGSQPVGLLYLGIDPADYLYPYIQQWPVPSDSGETLLVRREGDEVVFLNELRFRKNAALALREPLMKSELPAAKAALGHKGIVEGVDYRGVPVIASVRPVPGSPWFLIVKIDRAEALAQEDLWLMAGLIGALLLAAAGGVGFLWRQQRLHNATAQLRAAEAIAAGTSRYRAIIEGTTDAVITADGAAMIVGWNRAAGRMFGHTEAEAVGQPLTLVIPHRYRDGHLNGTKRIQAGGERHVIGKTVELHGLTKAGREFPLELTLSEWETAEGRFFAGIIRDITERR